MLSLVQVTARLLLYIMPSCGITEQSTLRDTPANATLLKGSIFTAGGEGTEVKRQII